MARPDSQPGTGSGTSSAVLFSFLFAAQGGAATLPPVLAGMPRDPGTSTTSARRSRA